MALISVSDYADVDSAARVAYQEAYDAAPSQYKEIAMDTTFGPAGLDLEWLGEFPQLVEFIGNRQVKNVVAHGFKAVTKTYEGTVGIKVADIRDNKVAGKLNIVRGIGEAAKKHPDELTFGLLKNGTVGLCYDGVAFFSAAHPLLDNDGEAMVDSEDDAIVQSNLITGSGPTWYLLKADSVLKPLVFGTREGEGYTPDSQEDGSESAWRRDQYEFGTRARVAAAYGLWQYAAASKATLTGANVDALDDLMGAVVTSTGRALNNDATHIVVPRSLRNTARALFGVATLANGATNPHYGRFVVIVSDLV